MDATSAAAAASAPADTPSAVASTKLTENFDTFLTLLTAQLRNQDPLKPLDTKDFVNQLVQFSEVEQSIQSNKSLEKLLDFQKTNQATAALNYIGNTVEVTGDMATLEDGAAAFSYTLPSEAASALVVIQDAAGQVVYSAAGETAAGRHEFTWDGTTAGGGTATPGNYRITVAAQDAEGGQLTASTTATGRVTGVETGESGVMLNLNGVTIPLSDVLSVKGAGSPASS